MYLTYLYIQVPHVRNLYLLSMCPLTLDISTDIIDVARLGRKIDTEGHQKRPLMISRFSNMERLRVI